jgi:O-antigen ligase
MQFCKKFVLHRSKIPQSFFLIGIITSYIFLMTNVGNSSENDLATINGRTYIWRIVVDHWNDSGFLFGHAGAYSLFSYSNDNSTLFEIYHAHNLVLQILWDWGIIGLILGLPLILVLLNGYMKVGWSGFVIGTLIFIEGLIEPVLSFNVQATGTLFLILYIKYVTTALSSQSRSVP